LGARRRGVLDTVGGDIERWGRERSADVVVVLWVIVVLKLVGAGAPLIFVGVGHLPAWTRSRRTRALGWAAAVGLTVYGGVLSVAGWLIEAGVVDAADDADEHALAWHAYFWDPWFALWGGAFVVAMWRSRPSKPFRTNPANVRHRRFNSAHGPARSRAGSAAVECAVSGDVDVATDAGATTRIGTVDTGIRRPGLLREHRRAAPDQTDICAMQLGDGRTDHAPHNAQPRRRLGIPPNAGYTGNPDAVPTRR
jgi:hypothetical protein